jgi:hypothetical protein
MARPTAADLSAIKQLLKRFADERTGHPQKQVARDFEELLLYLLQLSQSLDIDLLSSCKSEIARLPKPSPGSEPTGEVPSDDQGH